MKSRVLFLPVVLLFSAPVLAQSGGDEKSVLIGPWRIEASFTKEQKFDRCTMSRTVDNGLESRFARDQAGTSLTLTSPRWKLDNGKTYPVEFAAGSLVWKTDVTATADTVRVALTDDRFNKAIRNANRLEVRGAGATLRIPLDKSSAALARLERCYETNRNASETNPFVAPKP
ncbi:hypothetical protein [Taklimakanibacter deserti]|uniref:hypothetical protein n=1 Tax=Taklimakanibacter deserti TaxID=2267839 RepID=UPI000E6488A9